MTVMLKNQFRCPQSCHQCPICTSSLIVTRHSEDSAAPVEKKAGIGPYILSCPYCAWTSLEAGLIFDYRVNISGQMTELFKQRKAQNESLLNPSDHFNQLADFYKAQIEEITPSTPFRSRYAKHRDFSGLRRQPKPVPVMREAQNIPEGLHILSSDDTDDDFISHMANVGLSATPSPAQLAQQPRHSVLQTTQQLLPTATLLHTRRAKRCRTCKHNLLRPTDTRSSSSSNSSTTNRYRIRQLASSYIPRLTIRALRTSNDTTSISTSTNTTSTTSTSTASSTSMLKQGKPTHYLLTFHNPLYHPLRITLATPRFTPGKVASKITILCPSFDVGANRDIWGGDDNGSTTTSNTLSSAGTGTGIRRGGSATGSGMSMTGTGGAGGGAERGTGGEKLALKDSTTGYAQPEAGKVWLSERNKTGVVVEVVPGIRSATSTSTSTSTAAPSSTLAPSSTSPLQSTGGGGGGGVEGKQNMRATGGRRAEAEEKDEIEEERLKVPIFIRLEYPPSTTTTASTTSPTSSITSANQTQGPNTLAPTLPSNAEDALLSGLNGADITSSSTSATGAGQAEQDTTTTTTTRREMAYWCVLDFGRIHAI